MGQLCDYYFITQLQHSELVIYPSLKEVAGGEAGACVVQISLAVVLIVVRWLHVSAECCYAACESIQ